MYNVHCAYWQVKNIDPTSYLKVTKIYNLNGFDQGDYFKGLLIN